MYVQKAGLIENVEYFDNGKFSISGSEAKMIDPKQRISLECSYEALQYPESLSEFQSTGVYVGCLSNDFDNIVADKDLTSAFASTGMCNSIISNRVSYALGFTGPSMTIDTACSASLVAMDAACSAIRKNDCDQAVVLGVNLLLSPVLFVAFCSSKMLSPNGRCATFSDQADGYVRSEGLLYCLSTI